MKSKENSVDISLSKSLLKENEALHLQVENLTDDNIKKDKQIDLLTAENELLKEKQAVDARIMEEQKQRIKELYESLAKRFKKTSEVYNNPDQLTFEFINDLELEVTSDAPMMRRLLLMRKRILIQR